MARPQKYGFTVDVDGNALIGDRDNPDLQANTDGSVTVRNGLTVTSGGLTVTAGGLTLTAGATVVSDDVLFTLGTGSDQALVNRSTVLNTNTALAGVMVGTPITPAVAANSLIVSNITADGDMLLATQTGGNSRAWIWADTSAGLLTLYGAGTAVGILSATAVEVEDNILFALGNDQDQVLLNRTAVLNANTSLTGVYYGTPVTPALAANSLIIANTTASGDIIIAANTGGTSSAWLWVDSSASLMTLYAVGVSAIEIGTTGIVINEGSADCDFRIESNGNANMFVLDGGLDAVAIGGAAVATHTLEVTNATVHASTGRIAKFAASVAAPNQGDGYGVFEVDVTASGTFAGTTNAFSSWLNVAAAAVPGGNLICVQNNGIYLPSGITASSAKMIMGMRMQYVADDGANPGSLFCFSTNIFSNVLTALFDVNAIVDLGGSTGAQTGSDYKIPLLKDASTGTVWYVNAYHA